MRNTNPKRTPRRQSAQRIYGLVAFAVVLLLGFLVYQWLKWDLYLIWLLVVTFVTFIFYRYDKIQAQKPGAMRVPEVILLALLAIGGVLGGAYAQEAKGPMDDDVFDAEFKEVKRDA